MATDGNTAPGFAPAKINLTLHVTGQRADGYHLIDSLVVFAGVGDRVEANPADQLSLEVTGPRAAGVPADAGNLVLRAARLMDAAKGARLVLDKHLPTASGIGGGSSDAAATLRVLAQIWGVAPPATAMVLALGADVPVCLARRPARMSGIGECLAGVSGLPPFWLVLVNPGVAVPTPAIFRALTRKTNPPMPPTLPEFPTAAALAQWLITQRNDLQSAATLIAPVIGAVLRSLQDQPGCLLARMSGSGATCFGIFASPPQADAAAEAIAQASPGWWTAAAPALP